MAMTRAAGIAAICTGVLAVAAPVHAQGEPPGSEGSAVNQYLEVVPGADGATAPGVGTKKRTPLPRAANDALSQAPSATAKSLEEIATSSTYGAPTRPAEPGKLEPRTPIREPDVVPPTTSFDAALRSTVAVIGSASDARLIGLLLALVLTTLAAIALATMRARVA